MYTPDDTTITHTLQYTYLTTLTPPLLQHTALQHNTTSNPALLPLALLLRHQWATSPDNDSSPEHLVAQCTQLLQETSTDPDEHPPPNTTTMRARTQALAWNMLGQWALSQQHHALTVVRAFVNALTVDCHAGFASMHSMVALLHQLANAGGLPLQNNSFDVSTSRALTTILTEELPRIPLTAWRLWLPQLCSIAMGSGLYGIGHEDDDVCGVQRICVSMLTRLAAAYPNQVAYAVASRLHHADGGDVHAHHGDVHAAAHDSDDDISHLQHHGQHHHPNVWLYEVLHACEQARPGMTSALRACMSDMQRLAVLWHEEWLAVLQRALVCGGGGVEYGWGVCGWY